MNKEQKENAADKYAEDNAWDHGSHLCLFTAFMAGIEYAENAKWIDVNERLPELNIKSGPYTTSKFVLVKTQTGNIEIAFLNIKNRFIEKHEGNYVEDVTHWAELYEDEEK